MLREQYEGGRVGAKFRHAFVLKPSHDFSQLRNHSDRIVYATDGYANSVAEIIEQLEKSLSDFDANLDVLIPAGSNNICVLAATIITRNVFNSGRKNHSSYAMGVYNEGSYHFWRIPVTKEEEAYEIIQ